MSSMTFMRWALVLAASTAAAGCPTPTPFETKPSEEDLTAENLERIQTLEVPNPFKFVALGDTHDDYTALSSAVAAINARDDVEFVVAAGDLTDLGLVSEFEWTHDELARLDVPYLTVIGNHDALNNGARIYRDLYGPLDYSFAVGGVKFIFFNSNTLEFDGEAPSRPWLEQQLADLQGANSAIWVTHQEIAHPDDGVDGDGAAFYGRLLDKYPATSLVIHGHRLPHDFTSHHGTPVLQCGTFQVVFTYNVITVRDGAAIEIEFCDLDGCAPPVAVP